MYIYVPGGEGSGSLRESRKHQKNPIESNPGIFLKDTLCKESHVMKRALSNMKRDLSKGKRVLSITNKALSVIGKSPIYYGKSPIEHKKSPTYD